MATPFLAQLEIFSFNFAPKGYAQCNGQLLPINQNQALFSLLGTTYGGDGRVNFGLPDLRSRTPVGFGQTFVLGERGGEENHTLLISEIPQHNHVLMSDNVNAGNSATPASNTYLGKANGVNSSGGTFPVGMYGNAPGNTPLASQTVTNTGGSQAHNNLMPYLCLNVCIALQGIFPSQT
jgi:microcystin-dependent protein